MTKTEHGKRQTSREKKHTHTNNAKDPNLRRIQMAIEHKQKATAKTDWTSSLRDIHVLHRGMEKKRERNNTDITAKKERQYFTRSHSLQTA